MEKNNVLKAVALFDNIKALEVSIRTLEVCHDETEKFPINKIQLILSGGDIVEINNLTAEISKKLLSLLLEFKKSQLDTFETELKGL